MTNDELCVVMDVVLRDIEMNFKGARRKGKRY